MLAVVRSTATLLILAAAGAAGCGPVEEEQAAAQREEAAVEEAAPADTAPARTVTYFGETAQAYSIPGFEHNPHADVACTSCHSGMPGHSAHAVVACLQCHGDAGAKTASATVRPAECQACHHRADPPRDCARCHARNELAAPIDVTVSITAAARAHERALAFAHERHRTLECTRCHEPPRVTPVPGCATCHDNHHRPDADCATCHTQPATSHHDLATHRTCAGSGCHTDATVLALPLSRPLCLVCHQDRRDHEPGRECAQCHLIREGAATAAPPQGLFSPGRLP